MTKTPITWKFSPPESFPCHACGDNRAVWHVNIDWRTLPVSLCLCDTCADRPESEIVALVKGDKLK